MTPHPWTAIVLALAAFRLARLVGWDDFPPVQRARWWLAGGQGSVTQSTNSGMGITSEIPVHSVTYRRPLVAKFLSCSWCQGSWVGFAVYAAWAAAPRWSMYPLSALALAAAVGLVARWLDP